MSNTTHKDCYGSVFPETLKRSAAGKVFSVKHPHPVTKAKCSTATMAGTHHAATASGGEPYVHVVGDGSTRSEETDVDVTFKVVSESRKVRERGVG